MSPRMIPWRWDDPLRSLEMLSSLWTAAGLPSIGATAVVPYRVLFMTLQHLLVGKELTVRMKENDLELTVTEFDSPLDPRELAAGQFGEVRFGAKDVRWDEHCFDDLTAVLSNVHVRPGVPPVLVAAPVQLSATLSAESLFELVDRAVPAIRGELRDDGSVHLMWSRTPGFGSLEVDVEAVGNTLWLKPRAVTTGRKRWSLPSRAPSYPLPLPNLPQGLLLTSVEFDDGHLKLAGLLPQWRMEMPLGWLEDIVTTLSRAGRGILTWPPRLPGTG